MTIADNIENSLKPFFDKVSELTKVQRMLIFAATVILTILCFVYFLYLPKLTRINDLNNELDNIERQLVTAKKKAAHLKKYQNQIKEAETQLKVTLKALPEKKEIPSLLTGISQAGKDSGLEFILFQPKPEINKNFYSEIPLSINVKGSFHKTVIFFDQISRLPRIVNIKDISINALKDSNNLNTSCTAVTYRFVEPEKQQSKNKRKKK